MALGIENPVGRCQKARLAGLVLVGAALTFLLLWPGQVSAQPDGEWSTTLGGEADDFAHVAIQSDDGGYLVAGETGSAGTDSQDVWLVKLDADGKKEWARTFGGPLDDVGYDVNQTADGGYIVAGETHSFGTGSADKSDYWLIKIDSSGNVTTLAGQAGVSGSNNGQGTAARFKYPTGVAVDSSGNVYVADYNNHLIRRIDSSGNVITLAGSGSAGFADGQGSAAKFNFPTGVAADSSGNVYVADFDNHRIRKLSGKAKLLAYYDWSSFWSYVYNEEGKLLGKLKCLAFRGLCAAGAASFLTGMLEGD